MWTVLQRHPTPGAQPRLKSWGTNKVWAPTPGHLRPAPGQRPGWGLGAEGVAPSHCEGPGILTPEIFLKTHMLNPAFWWLLAVKFLAFWKLLPRSYGGTIHCWSPQPKNNHRDRGRLVPNFWVGGTSLPRSLWLLRLCPTRTCTTKYNRLAHKLWHRHRWHSVYYRPKATRNHHNGKAKLKR